MLHTAGFATARLEEQEASARFPSLDTWIEAELATLLPHLDHPPAERIDAFRAAATQHLAPYASPSGAVAFTTRALLATSTRR